MEYKLIDLGKLTKEQKETYWKDTISGSQAWMAENEPENLIRDKLGKERIFSSKYDVFRTKTNKAKMDAKMANGVRYEPIVMQEYQEANPDKKFIYEDHTYQLEVYNNNELMTNKITATPDYILKDKNGNVILVGDIKISKDADKAEIMIERYRPQLLHNCYVLKCYNGEIAAKGYTNDGIYKYEFVFTDEDFIEYEKRLLTFITLWISGIETSYDALREAKTKKLVEGEVLQANAEEAKRLEDYISKKELIKSLEEEVKTIEDFYKENYNNTSILFNDKLLVISESSRIGSVDYKSLLADYNIGNDIVEQYRKQPTTSKSLKVKGV